MCIYCKIYVLIKICLPGVIGKVSYHKETFYSLIADFGTLNDSYRAWELEPYSGIISVIFDIKQIYLHDAVKFTSNFRTR